MQLYICYIIYNIHIYVCIRFSFLIRHVLKCLAMLVETPFKDLFIYFFMCVCECFACVYLRASAKEYPRKHILCIFARQKLIPF